MPNERRKKTRVHFETRVLLKTDDLEVGADGDSRDISIRGMFVRTDEKIPVGTPCEIEILLTGTSSRLSLKVTGKVIRQDPAGLGIVFDSIDVDSYFHLKNILLYNASDPVALEEEVMQLR